MSKESIQDCVRKSLEKYFHDLDGETPHHVYEMVMRTVQKPVLAIAMERSSGYQYQAA